MNIELDKIYEPIKKDLNRVEAFLSKELRAKNGPIAGLSDSFISNTGKRLRPALALFSARSVLEEAEVKKFEEKLVNLAAAIELIHTAALVHDDVVDHSRLRRRRPTINAGFSNEAAIAFGDYLYCRGINLLACLKDPDIISCLTQAALGMCEGELFQILNRGNFKLKRQIYMNIIRKKTALLMSSSCSAAVMLVNRKDAFFGSFSSFGLNFGIAFQIIDDCLDLVGREKDLGKSVGLDLRMGELTLPLLFLMESNANGDTKELMKLIYSAKTNGWEGEAIREVLLDSGALLKARNIAGTYIEEAKENLGVVKNSIFKERLITLADFALGRLTLEDISPR